MRKILSILALLIHLSVNAQEQKYQKDYIENFSGISAKFRTYIFDVSLENIDNWNSYSYFISCENSRIKPRFPFLKYDKKVDLLQQFNIHTGKLEKTFLEKDTGKIPPLFLYQPKCEEDFIINL
ncbi:MAG: hypothetical protein AABY03_00265 [Nanoarchaeota archaeon]